MNNADKIDITTEDSKQKINNKFSSIFEKGDQIIAFAAGGSFAGGLIAQVPGAVVGALSGVVFGIFYKNHKTDTSKEA